MFSKAEIVIIDMYEDTTLILIFCLGFGVMDWKIVKKEPGIQPDSS